MLRIDESSRTKIIGLNVLLRNEMVIFTLMNPIGSSLGRGHRCRERERSPLRHILCYDTPFIKIEERATLDRYHHFHGHSGMCA